MAGGGPAYLLGWSALAVKRHGMVGLRASRGWLRMGYLAFFVLVDFFCFFAGLGFGLLLLHLFEELRHGDEYIGCVSVFAGVR